MSIIGLADEVVTSLNAAFTGQFVAERSFTPEFDLKDNENLKVQVVPFGREFSQVLTRGEVFDKRDQVRIGIGQRIEKDGEAAVIQVVEDIANHFDTVSKLSGPGGNFVRRNIKMLMFYDYKKLDRDHQVISIVELTYTEFKI